MGASWRSPNDRDRRPPEVRDLLWAIGLLLVGTALLAYLPAQDAALQWVAATTAFLVGLALLVRWWLDRLDE